MSVEFSLDYVKMGDVIAVQHDGKDFFGAGIALKQVRSGFSIQDSQFVHVEISGGGHRSVRIAPPRASRIDITKVYKGRYLKILRYKDEYWFKKRKHVAWVFATLCNTKYDKGGILAFLSNWFKQKTSHWFCSEGGLFALQTEYPKALNGIQPEKCMPAHFVSSPEFETVWEGYIPKDYIRTIYIPLK